MAVTQSCGIGEWFVHDVHCLKAPRTAAAFANMFQDVLDGRTLLAPLGRRASAVIWRDFHLHALLPRIERALKTAARQSREGAGSSEEAYRLALLAERLTQVLVQQRPPGCDRRLETSRSAGRSGPGVKQDHEDVRPPCIGQANDARSLEAAESHR